MNFNLAKLNDAGFGIEIRSARNGWAVAYIIDQSKRRCVSIQFRSNKLNASKLTTMIQDSAQRTHLDRMMRECLRLTPLAQERSACFERDELALLVGERAASSKGARL
jgi:hypothetical protein